MLSICDAVKLLVFRMLSWTYIGGDFVKQNFTSVSTSELLASHGNQRRKRKCILVFRVKVKEIVVKLESSMFT